MLLLADVVILLYLFIVIFLNYAFQSNVAFLLSSLDINLANHMVMLLI